MEWNEAAASAAPKRIPLHHVAAVVAGNGLEFYDFVSYSLFAVYIGKAFFPSDAPGRSLLLSLATFGIGFTTRPIGAIVLGGLGDRIGRKPAMLLSLSLMALGMLGVALTPGYAQIGLAAPLLIVLFRLVQGFALGGEVGATTAYLVEAAPPARRGLFGAMQSTSQDIAVMTASLTGVVLAAVLGHSALETWGWRIAFLIGLLIVPFGLMVRRNLPETLHAADDAAFAPDATTGSLRAPPQLRRYIKPIVIGLAVIMGGTIGTYTFNYMTTYALDTLHLPPGIAFGVTLVSSFCAVCCEPLSGALSDRFGRRPVMLIPGTLGIFLIIPVFWLITHYPARAVLYGGIAVLSLIFAMAQTPFLVALTEVLPPRIRAGVVATVYSLAVAIFGGSTQFVIKELLIHTGNPMMPAFYWTTAAVIALIAMSQMPESAPRRLALQTPMPAQQAGGSHGT